MINISDLSKKKKERKELRNKVYKIILKKCTKKIIDKSNSISEDEYIYYSVPQVLFGYPLINKEECSMYLINEMIKGKFMVKYLGNGILFISWKNIDKKSKKIKYFMDNVDKVRYPIDKVRYPIDKVRYQIDKNKSSRNNKNAISKIKKNEFRNIKDIPTTIKFLY